MTEPSTPTAASPRRRGPYATGVQRRNEIVEKAIAAFVDRRVETSSLRSVADAIGESHRTVQHYFPTREALLVEVLRQHENAIAQERIPGPIGEELEWSASRNADRPGVVAVHTEMLAASVGVEGGDAKDFFTERFAQARQRIVEQLIAEHAPASSREEHEDVAAIMLAAFDGLQIQWLLDPTLDLRRMIHTLVRMVDAITDPKRP